MILYDYFRSSAAYRVRIALEMKGLAVERRQVNLASRRAIAAKLSRQKSPSACARARA